MIVVFPELTCSSQPRDHSSPSPGFRASSARPLSSSVPPPPPCASSASTFPAARTRFRVVMSMSIRVHCAWCCSAACSGDWPCRRDSMRASRPRQAARIRPTRVSNDDDEVVEGGTCLLCRSNKSAETRRSPTKLPLT